MDAAASADINAMVELVREDAVLTMPPNPFWFTSREALFAFVGPNLDPASPTFAGHWRHLPWQANGQPAVAGYLQRPGTSVYRAQLLDVLRVEDGRIAEITTFEPHLFPAFGLPMTL
jgi:ketosteroid isomerase-like protein